MSQIILRFELHGKHYSRVMEILDQFELYGFVFCVHLACSEHEVYDGYYTVSELSTGYNTSKSFFMHDSIMETKHRVLAILQSIPEETMKAKISAAVKYIKENKFTPIE